MLILISDAFDKSLPEKLKAFGEVTDDKTRLKDADVVLTFNNGLQECAFVGQVSYT